MAAFVQGDRVEPDAGPSGFGSLVCGAGVKGLVATLVWEDESVSAGALLEAVALEVAAQRVGDRDAAFAGAAFGFDVADAAVPASFNVHDVLVEVDVVPVERL